MQRQKSNRSGAVCRIAVEPRPFWKRGRWIKMEAKKQTRRPLNDLDIASGSKERRTDGEPEKERNEEDERGEEKTARWGLNKQRPATVD